MAFHCSNCSSVAGSTGLGDLFSCFTCGVQAPRKHAGEPHHWVEPAGEPDEGLAVEDTAGEGTVEATPEGDDE